MINRSEITKGIETVLKENVTGYLIERNPERNEDPNVAGRDKGWIGIYRGDAEYDPMRIGVTPWRVQLTPRIEIQVASWDSGEECEEKLEFAVKEIITVLNANRTLNGTVNMTVGYTVTDEVNKTVEGVYFQAAIITIKAEVKA